MREFFKNLRKMEENKLLEKLNYNQDKYNKYCDLRYKYGCNDELTNYYMDLYLGNMNKIKKVFNERKIVIEFINGWEVK